MGASTAEIDFSDIPDEDLPRFSSGKMKKLTPKQIRARARRAAKKGDESMTQALVLLHKPIEEWDEHELARGRPRAADGTFKGKTPEWIPRALHEQAMDRFRDVIRGDLNSHTLLAVQTVKWILENEEVDEKGRPIVPPASKLDASKFLIEHLLGKPKQEVKQDISVKLQGILLNATVAGPSSGEPAALDVESWEYGDDDE